MLDEPATPTEAEERLNAVMTAYVKAVDSGHEPDRVALLAEHPDLAEELTAFFADHDDLQRLGAPLREVARAALNLADPPERPRDFGDYELREEIGRGGMGVVYAARQKSLRRVVALKTIPAGPFAPADDLLRFRAEAEAAATLDHPNIVPIYDVGEHGGFRYFSMKLVDNGSLAARSDLFRNDPRAAARLVVTVARAVHHAHQRGILHRDLKPSNILLDTSGRPHVADFGLAKRIEAGLELTHTGALLGSPPYMAPEQANGQKGGVTTATDVYGLGAILYSLLTGQPPFQADSAWETIEQVKGRRPDPPSGTNRLVDRDLQTICLKCLEKEPARRYGSAEALADDLGCWLDGKPIQARHVGRLDRAGRWCRRNPIIATLAGLVVLMVGAGVAGLLAGNAAISRKSTEVLRERDEARRAVDRMYSRVAEEWLRRQAGLEPIQREFLQEASRYYTRFERQADSSPALRLEAGRASYRVGAIEKKLGRYVEAETAFRRAVDLFQRLVTDAPSEAENRRELAAGLVGLGNLLSETGRSPDAEQAYRRGVELLEKLAADSPASAEYRRALALGHCNLGNLLSSSNRHPQAEQAYLRAVELQEKLAADSPASAEYRAGLALSYDNLGYLLGNAGRPREAERAYLRAVELREKLAADSPASAEHRAGLAESHNGLGRLLWRMGRRAEAERENRSAVELLERLAADSPTVIGYRDELADSRNDQGLLLKEAGRWEEAEQAFRRAIELQERLAADSPGVSKYRRNLAGSLDNLGLVLREAGRLEKAEQAHRRALALREELSASAATKPEYRSDIGGNLQNLARVMEARGDWGEARRLLLRAIVHQRAALAANPRKVVFRQFLRNHYLTLARACVQLGEHGEASRALGEMLPLFPDSSRDAVNAASMLVCGCAPAADRDARLTAEARASAVRAYVEQARAILKDMKPPDEADTATLGQLAWLLASAPVAEFRDPDRAITLATKGAGRAPAHRGFWSTLGVAHYRNRDWEASIAALEKSMALHTDGDATVWFFLAMCHCQKGDMKQARPWYEKAVAWMEETQPKDEGLVRLRAEAAALIAPCDRTTPSGKETTPKH